MNFENYIPTNFDYDKMNAFKFLYLYRRKQAILLDLLKVCDLTNLEDLQNKKPFIRSYQYIQQETGMSEEEFLKTTSELEADYDIPEDITEDLRELHEQISEMLQHKNQDKEIFKEIVNENFNNQEKWPNGFPPYS